MTSTGQLLKVIPRKQSTTPAQRIAVVGSGAAGLAAAWTLSKTHQVTLYEADSRLGGHCHTITAPTAVGDLPVDTGFIVYNEVNYPSLCAMFAHLGVETCGSDMSFAVSIRDGQLEYSGTGVGGLFAQRRNMARPLYWRMVWDLLRFYREMPLLLEREDLENITLGRLLDRQGYSKYFRFNHLYPMAAAIWSMPVHRIEEFPAATFIRFYQQHGLLSLKGRPRWRTVAGGSQAYVRAIMEDFRGVLRSGEPVRAVVRVPAGVQVKTDADEGVVYDQVVLAAHADQAFAMLAMPTEAERAVLGAFDYEKNVVMLHSDETLMPRRREVWSSWNYLSSGAEDVEGRLSVTYWMNRLQSIDLRAPLFVTLNPLHEPRPQSVIARIPYDHPSFDGKALAAQKHLASIQGVDRIWYCGSYFGYGFHEDAFTSGLNVATGLGCALPWQAGAAAEAAVA
ncbi:MAG: FAD-dependent oxidoreductase [Alphaproteobacteria bacterium]|nr:FAD-dependent oxidoreductase [Alphaproteobacteria bacterium]